MHKKGIFLGQQGHGQKKVFKASPPKPHSPFCRYTNANNNESFLNESSMVALMSKVVSIEYETKMKLFYIFHCRMESSLFQPHINNPAILFDFCCSTYFSYSPKI